MTMTSRTYYETGIETPEILGSGSSFSSVITTTDENDWSCFSYIIRPNGRDVKQFSNYIYRRVRLWEINAIRWATG